MYEVGFALCCHWSVRDASVDQLCQIQALGDGREWVENSPDPFGQFISTVSTGEDDIFSDAEHPSKSFLAGFVNGCRSS